MQIKNRNFVFKAISLSLFVFSSIAYAKEPDAEQRKFISEGMRQGEVVKKIGLPDYQTSYDRPQPCYSVVEGEQHKQQVIVSQCGAPVKVETWTFNPAPHDNQIMTVITFENGTVTAISREISR